MYIDPKSFSMAVLEKISAARGEAGIGTLGEKTLHAALKLTLEPREQFREVPVGRYVADICNEEGIIEIQTGGFFPLKDKLAAYLPEHTVRVVCPIPAVKYICWIDEESGSVTPPRKSPRKGTWFHIFRQMVYIKHLLPCERLILCPLLMRVTDYRLLNGWSEDKKRGSVRYERIPHEILDLRELCTPEDYAALLPAALPDPFTAKMLAAAAGLRTPEAQNSVRMLVHLGALERCGSEGRAYLYRRKV